ncbi:MAG: tRNA 5-methoxyuridine(34)/uridine 5-oxyacetic acid(34) synthase CmoB [bacterium]
MKNSKDRIEKISAQLHLKKEVSTRLLNEYNTKITTPIARTYNQHLKEIKKNNFTNHRFNQKVIQIDLINPRNTLEEQLKKFKPWRKGPFQIGDIHINTEWQCYMKWERLKPLHHLMTNKRILDIGAGSGYFSLRSLEHQPTFILAIDPYIAYYYQFEIIVHQSNTPNIEFLPLGIESFTNISNIVDVILNMGILYHRKDPIAHLKHCQQLLSPKGHLILETLIWPGESEVAFSPKDRYASMKNVYHIPTWPCLKNWCLKSGFSNIECIERNITQFSEQQQTKWTYSHSLEQFLNPKDPRLTIEGYPRPQRSTLICTKK